MGCSHGYAMRHFPIHTQVQNDLAPEHVPHVKVRVQ